MDRLLASRDAVTGDFSRSLSTHHNQKDFLNVWHYSKYDGPLDVTGLPNSNYLSFMYPFEFENNFDFQYALFARKWWWLPYILSGIYIILVKILGPRIMENREAIKCKLTLKYWNLFLAVFSFLGMIRTVPHLFMLLYGVGWQGVVCFPAYTTYGFGPSGLWTFLFVMSKIFEFLDTLFLVIKKRPVSLLHWWHHASVLLYCWDALMWETPSGIIFVAMNFSVHALMYYYYYLVSCGSCRNSKVVQNNNDQIQNQSQMECHSEINSKDSMPLNEITLNDIKKASIHRRKSSDASTKSTNSDAKSKDNNSSDSDTNKESSLTPTSSVDQCDSDLTVTVPGPGPCTTDSTSIVDCQFSKPACISFSSVVAAKTEASTTKNVLSDSKKQIVPPSRNIWWGHIVTKLQILQMVLGMASVSSHLYFRRIYQNCDGSDSNLYCAGFIYASYFILFAQFYVERYKSQIRLGLSHFSGKWFGNTHEKKSE